MSFLVWLLPVFSGMADAAQRGVIKLTDVHRFTLLGFGYLLALPWYGAWLAYTWPETVHDGFWAIIAMQVPLLVIAQILTVEAHRASPLIVTAPYMALTPACLLITSPLMGAGVPTVWGGLGVLIITGGVYILNTREGDISLWTPFKTLAKERGAVMMLGVAIIYSITANFDYLGWQKSNEPFYLLVAHGLIGVACVVLAAVYVLMKKLTVRQVSPIGSWKPLIMFGGVVAVTVIPQMLAFRWIPNVPYVIVGKRAGFMLFAIIIALALATMKKYKEKHAEEKRHLGFRLTGTVVMFIGMTMIVLWGKTVS